MLGDLTAEEGSWRTSVLSEAFPQPISRQDWQLIKEQASEELIHDGNKTIDVCKVAKNAMKATLLGSDIQRKRLAKAIPTTSRYDEASTYAAWSAQPGEQKAPSGASLIWINEHVHRAAHVTGTEYFIPIVIPAEDISQGWYKGVRAVKEVDATGALVQISFFNDARPKEGAPLSFPIARIIPCQADESCQSDSQISQFSALNGIAELLSITSFDGHKYRLVFLE